MILAAVSSDGFGMLTASLYALGLALIITEFVHRSRMLFAGPGLILLLLSLTVYSLTRRSVYGLFYLVLGALALLFAVHLTLLVVNKREWIKHYKENRSEGLIGKIGVATTDIVGSGHMLMDGTVVLVSSHQYVKKGSEVRVIEIGAGRILVEATGDCRD